MCGFPRLGFSELGGYPEFIRIRHPESAPFSGAVDDS